MLIGKAFGQMRLAAAELDPSWIRSPYLRQQTGRMRTMANPQQLRAAQRALPGAMMTVAAAVAERRVRRALGRASAPVPSAGDTSE